MKAEEKLRNIWTSKLLIGETINIVDIYQFSKIRLKKKRSRKKFNKDYTRYVSEKIRLAYWGCLTSGVVYNTFKNISGFNLPDVEPMNGIPDIELVYLDGSPKDFDL